MIPSATQYNGLMVASPPDAMSLGTVVFLEIQFPIGIPIGFFVREVLVDLTPKHELI